MRRVRGQDGPRSLGGWLRPVVVAVLVGAMAAGAFSLFRQPPPLAANATAVLRIQQGRAHSPDAEVAGELLIYFARTTLSRPGALGEGNDASFQLAFFQNSTEPFADVVARNTIIKVVAFHSTAAVAENTVDALIARLSQQLKVWQEGVPELSKIVLVTLPPAPATYAGGSRTRAMAGLVLIVTLGASAIAVSVSRVRSRRTAEPA